MGKLKVLVAPYPPSKWNLGTLAIVWAIIVAGSHYFLTPVVGVPEPAGFFAAMVVLLPLWSVFIRRADKDGRGA